MSNSTAQTIELGGHDVSVQIEERPLGADLTFTAGEAPAGDYMKRLANTVLAWRTVISRDGCRTSFRMNDRAIQVRVEDSSAGQIQTHLSDLDRQLTRIWGGTAMAAAAGVGASGSTAGADSS